MKGPLSTLDSQESQREVLEHIFWESSQKQIAKDPEDTRGKASAFSNRRSDWNLEMVDKCVRRRLEKLKRFSNSSVVAGTLAQVDPPNKRAREEL